MPLPHPRHRAGRPAAGVVPALALCAQLLAVPVAGADDRIPAAAQAALTAGASQDLILLFDDSAIAAEAEGQRRARGLAHDAPDITVRKAARYRVLKDAVRAAMGAEHELLRDYPNLPMNFVRLKSAAALARLAARAEFRGAFVDEPKFPVLDATSQALVGQPAVAALGPQGAGATVLVVDSGVNYGLAEFGGCSAPGVPAACKVVAYANLADASATLDSSGHGSNVSGIVVGVAPQARLAVMNVFGAAASTSDSLVLQAINWGIANQAAYNIRAINLSLGDGQRYTDPCDSGNVYAKAVAAARAAGMVTVASAGNNAYLDGIGKPGCTPGVVSVGAVYSANFGTRAWSACTDAATAADQVTCFSNSASFLTLLAPGALITAGGATYGGTSQASPFVAAGLALLQAAFPGESLDQSLARITASAPAVTDHRNGIVRPRLDLLAALRPENDGFARRIALAGSNGSGTGTSLYASKEAGEPDHAGVAGGKSVWWRWTAPASGQVTLDTAGSSFDTLLAAYSGDAVASLVPLAANDNDGGLASSRLLFQAAAGSEYALAVDGAGGQSGAVALHWSLDSTAQADIAVAGSTLPSAPLAGATYSLLATVSNAGPRTATGVRVELVLPDGTALISAPPGCLSLAGLVRCELGSLASAASLQLDLGLRSTRPGAAMLALAANSDVPDPDLLDNTATTQASVQAAATVATVPALPHWAALLLASMLLGLGTVRGRGRG